MRYHDFVSDGFLALIAVGLVLLCSGCSLSHLASLARRPHPPRRAGSPDGAGDCRLPRTAQRLWVPAPRAVVEGWSRSVPG
jgi:hypothetical protein